MMGVDKEGLGRDGKSTGKVYKSESNLDFNMMASKHVYGATAFCATGLGWGCSQWDVCLGLNLYNEDGVR